MAAVDVPPQIPVPSISAPAPNCVQLTDQQAQAALSRLRLKLPSTEFQQARPSKVCNLVALRLANGQTAFTDVTGRFFLLAFALDTHTGSPADNSEQVDRQLEQLSEFPSQPIPGVFPKDYN